MALVGDILSYSTGSWTETPAYFTQKWMRDGVDIPGATDITYVLAEADLFCVVSLEVSAFVDEDKFQTVLATGSVGVTEADPYYYEIVVQFDGSLHNDGASFDDSGPWNRSLTGFGNPSISDNMLVLPDGNDYLLVPAHQDCGLVGDFTLEWWDVEITTSGGRIAGQYQSSSSLRGWIANLDTGGSVALGIWTSGTTGTMPAVGTIPGVAVGVTIGHIRLCRSGSTVRLFADGIFIASIVFASNQGNFDAQLAIGGTVDNSGTTGLAMLKGKIGAYRQYKVALNTTDDGFTAPGRPLPDLAPRIDPLATDGELQVLRIDATTTDDQSPSAHTLTWANRAVVGDDIVFDGTTYAEAAADLDFALWGDFTIQIRGIEFDSFAASHDIIARYLYAGAGWIVRAQSATILRFYYRTGSALANLNVDAAVSFSTGVKYDIDLDRDGSDFRMYVDGVMVGKFTISGPIYHSRAKLRIGLREDYALSPFVGKLEEVIITNGRALIASDEGYGVPYLLSDPVVSVVSGPDPYEAGTVLSVTTGSWARSPDSYSYQWLRDDVEIVGATSSTYEAVLADEGTVLTVAVTATNANGVSDPATVLAQMQPHRYWRIYCTKTWADSPNCSIQELEMAESYGGADTLAGGTASASTEVSSHEAGKAIDNTLSGNPWASSATPAWWRYDYGLGNEKAIREVRMWGRLTTWNGQNPEDYTVEYSDDNVIWTVVATVVGQVTTGDHDEWTIQF